MSNFIPIKQTRVADEIMAQLKEAILSGDFKAGEKLPSERELTETFQVSRVVVREAIRALEMTGFVEIRQGAQGGAFVQELGLGHLVGSYLDLFMAGQVSVAELVQVRQHIEPEITRLAALGVTPEYARRLREACDAENRPTDDHAWWIKQGIAIDYVLAEMCGNRLYRAILEPLLRLTQEIVLVVKPEQTVIHDHAEHEVIVQAVIDGRADDAAAAMKKHIDGVGKRLFDLEKVYRERRGLSV